MEGRSHKTEADNYHEHVVVGAAPAALDSPLLSLPFFRLQDLKDPGVCDEPSAECDMQMAFIV